MSNEFPTAKQFWDEAKSQLGYDWMDLICERPGFSTEYTLNDQHCLRCDDAIEQIALKVDRYKAKSRGIRL